MTSRKTARLCLPTRRISSLQSMFPLRESGVIPTARAVHQAAPPVAAVHRAAEAEAFNAENYLNFTENAVFSVWGRQKCRPLLM